MPASRGLAVPGRLDLQEVAWDQPYHVRKDSGMGWNCMREVWSTSITEEVRGTWKHSSGSPVGNPDPHQTVLGCGTRRNAPRSCHCSSYRRQLQPGDLGGVAVGLPAAARERLTMVAGIALLPPRSRLKFYFYSVLSK